MRVVLWSLAFALVVPALLLVIALGPVILGILCAVGFGLIVFVIGNAVIGLGAVGGLLLGALLGAFLSRAEPE